MKFQTPGRPYSVHELCDGGAYVFPRLKFSQTNLFLRIACADELLIKMPSARGQADYHRFVRLREQNPEDQRAPEEAEFFERLERTLENFPALVPLLAVDPALAHYLTVYK